ncbi:MAG: glycosyl hydrolase [Thermoanaerobaculia bacterium]
MKRLHFFVVLVVCALLIVPAVMAAKKAAAEESAEEKDILSAGTFSGLQFRGLGPAIASGRISEIAVDPRNPKIYYVAVSSGGVWKTVNSGTTWTPIFDNEGSYSIGTVTVDPNNPLIVWVGTGENNSQRSVAYGDGVYKSMDGGKSWKNVGLENSEHIGKIIVHPDNSDIVFVASQGPLWGPGGDRGLYKTEDGGETWKKILDISENTGVNEVLMDPRDPDVLYASAYQRRRRVWTLIDGGPESGIYKSTDGGENWQQLEAGLPKEDMGRIGMAISPADPDVVYAIIEASGEDKGFYRSLDAGVNWENQNEYVSGSGQYYQEIIADPENVDRVYSMDTWMMVTEDGGKSFHKVGETFKHVDNHSLWINPEDTDYLLAGCDGGVYESWDRGATWHYKANLPVTQFYKVGIDNDTPFYNLYGGTQDNTTLGGPSRNVSGNGILNSDWITTVGGDGFQTRVDPEDPNIIYSQWQYGGLVRFDKRSGEEIDIRPQHGKDEEPIVFNWDSPLIISPHSHTRLYFAGNRLFRSDDRGDTWRPVSPDLSRQIDRNRLEVMDRVWSVDAVAKNLSTSFYGNIVSLAESPLEEGLIYAGTDDGLIQVTADGGENWRRIESFPVVPSMTYVAYIVASQHDADTVIAAFNNHKNSDFKPYVLKSTDRGATWTSITGDLPERGSVFSLAEDHVNPELLFAGTEFGAFFTLDGGGQWIQLEGGLPTIAVRDMQIQQRENDLVLATFGRGFYILDDYSPLRRLNRQILENDSVLFPVKDAWMYMESHPLGMPGKGFLGDSLYSAPNPPFGAVITYYLDEDLKTRKELRQEAEKELVEKGEPVYYPGWDELRAEDREEKPVILLTVSDREGNVVRRLTGPTKSGFHRVAWDLRYPASTPTSLEPFPADNPFEQPPKGPMVVPGSYQVSIAKVIGGEVTPLGESQSFETVPLGTATLAAADKEELLAFQQKTARLQRGVLGAVKSAEEAQNRLSHVKKAIADTPQADPGLMDQANSLEAQLKDIQVELSGDTVVASHSERTPMSITSRVNRIVGGQWTSTSAPTQTNRDAYDIASEEFAEVLEKLRVLIGDDLAQLEQDLEAAGGPWTPGRLPNWQPE